MLKNISARGSSGKKEPCEFIHKELASVWLRMFIYSVIDWPGNAHANHN
jgi:hypothetical protein